MKGAGYLQTFGHKPLLALRILPAGQKGRIVNRRQPLTCSRGSNAGDGGLQELTMRSAYNFNPEFSCFCLAPNLRHKAGLVLAFVVFGSIAGASGVVLQMTGHEPNADGRSVIAAIPLNPSATLSTVVSPAFSAVSAPDNRQSGSPANSAQAAPVDAITAAVTAPATTSATELSQQPVAASRKTRRAARNGATGAGTTLLRGANSMRITGAGAATAMNDQVRAGDRPPDRQGDWARNTRRPRVARERGDRQAAWRSCIAI